MSTLRSHLHTAVLASAVVCGFWGLVEPMVPLTRRAGVTFLPFLSAGPLLLTYLAVSIATYAALGGVVGAVLGFAGGIIASARRSATVRPTEGPRWSAVLYTRFLTGRVSFVPLERWQTAYIPVYAVWAWIVVVLFPIIFNYR